jgi:hypothetical protein
MTLVNTDDDTYNAIKEISKLLDEAKVPPTNRTMKLSHHAFIELGGTEETWQKLESEQL